jgi:ribosomal protein L11 methyltransferase
VRVPAAEREQLLARLLELAPHGFEEVERPGMVEFGVYTDAAGAAVLGAELGPLPTSPVAASWEEAWRSFHRPVRAGGLWIGPPWLDPPAGVEAVVIDPGRAFGTGAHATTRLCVELLAATARGSLLDLGCGSGVLAIAGARLGFGPIVAVDDDPVAVDVAAANAAANGVAVELRVADATAAALPRADVAVANVSLSIVERVLSRLDAGVVLTAGYLDGQVPTHGGWRRSQRATLEGWAADRFRRA